MIYRAHRGGGAYLPENTMPAFKDAMGHGFKYIETDPRFTKDGEIILLHDATINRTCRNQDGSEIGTPITPGELTYAELMRYDAGIYKGEEFRGTRIPRLSELLSLAEGSEVIIALDKKIGNSEIAPLLELAARFNTRVAFSCMDTERIRAVLESIPDAYIDYDGPATDEALREVCSLVSPERLAVWLYLDRPNFAWLEPTRKTSAENCARVKRYATLGIGNLIFAEDVKEALAFSPDIIEV